MIVALYLIAIVAANLSVAFFGPQFAVLNSFLFIGLDITARDLLHDRWHGRYLWRNMALLIISGSALSALLNWQALPIAIASCVAFFAAGAVDALVYAWLGDRAFLVRSNGSNVLASIVDTVIFVALAFGFPMLWDIVLLAIVAKLAGGFVWSYLIYRVRYARAAT